jgi:O-antigen ligase
MTQKTSWIFWTLIPLITIFATPGINTDSTNLPRLAILGTFSTLLFFQVINRIKFLNHSKLKLVYSGIFLFLIALLLPLLLTNAPVEQQVFGVYGRNTGVLTYVFLLAVFLCISISDFKATSRAVIWSIVATSTFESIYAGVQYLGFDPIDWQASETWIRGTLINPNFLAAFLGIAEVIILVLLTQQKNSKKITFYLIFQYLLNIIILILSTSMQGLIMTALGIVFVLYLQLRERNFRMHIIRSYWGFVILITLLSVFGILQTGPLSKVMYQDSVTFRGDYWYSGIKMFLKYPFTGVGIDSYGDNYLKFRSFASVTQRDPNIASDVAHNVLIDFAANGGLLLLLAYLFLNLIVLFSVIRIFKTKTELSVQYLAILIAWVAFQSQSIISMNQIVIVTVGWMLAGLVLGFERQLSSSLWMGVSSKAKKKPGLFGFSNGFMASIGALIGFVVSSAPALGDLNWRASLLTGDSTKVIAAADAWPRNSGRYLATANGYMQFQKFDEAKTAIENGLRFNQMNIELWRIILQNPSFSEAEKKNAIKVIRDLDPQRK